MSHVLYNSFLGKNCHDFCGGRPFTCLSPNYQCQCHDTNHCQDNISGPVCLSLPCDGGERKCVESQCSCTIHCSGVSSCGHMACSVGVPACKEGHCSCHDPCKLYY